MKIRPIVVGMARDNLDERIRDRHRFATLMATIRQGMPHRAEILLGEDVGLPKDDVLRILGEPDGVRVHDWRDSIQVPGLGEIWRYGTNSDSTFPTLGCVYLTPNGHVLDLYGDTGNPPNPKLFQEHQLRGLLRTINKAPELNGSHYDPRAIIEIVNNLQPLGKEKALAAIDEYLRVTPSHHENRLAREGLFLVLRVLFEVPDYPPHMPPMNVGAPWPPEPGGPFGCTFARGVFGESLLPDPFIDQCYAIIDICGSWQVCRIPVCHDRCSSRWFRIL